MTCHVVHAFHARGLIADMEQDDVSNVSIADMEEDDVSDNVSDIVLESEDDDHGVEDKSDGKLTFDEIFEYITSNCYIKCRFITLVLK